MTRPTESIDVSITPTTARWRRWWGPRGLWITGGVLALILMAIAVAIVTLTAEPTSDRVVGVTYRCVLFVYTLNKDRTWDTTPGEGQVCVDNSVKTYGVWIVTQRLSVRAVVTVRTPAGGSYVVETDRLDVQVGDPWPPSGTSGER